MLSLAYFPKHSFFGYKIKCHSSSFCLYAAMADSRDNLHLLGKLSPCGSTCFVRTAWSGHTLCETVWGHPAFSGGIFSVHLSLCWSCLLPAQLPTRLRWVWPKSHLASSSWQQADFSLRLDCIDSVFPVCPTRVSFPRLCKSLAHSGFHEHLPTSLPPQHPPHFLYLQLLVLLYVFLPLKKNKTNEFVLQVSKKNQWCAPRSLSIPYHSFPYL